MPKGQKGKSSASSATRKKHAAKKGDPAESSTAQPQSKKSKGKNKEPRPKVYIPPPKYQPLQPDPLDTLGLVGSLPADLVVVLRRLAKKDVITRKRALDELLEWASREDEDAIEGLIGMIPVWFHHLPNLFVHPARQLRLSAVYVHHALLRMKELRTTMISYLTERASEKDQEKILGTWCMIGADVDRQIAAAGRRSWDEAVRWTSADEPVSKEYMAFSQTAFLPRLSSFLQEMLEDPLALFYALHPLPAPAAPPGKPGAKPSLAARQKEETEPSRAKSELDEEAEDDRIGRLRVGALGALIWILDTCPRNDPLSVAMVPPLDVLLISLRFWTHINHAQVPPWVSAGHDGGDHVSASRQGYGYGQPLVRRAMWGIVKVLMGKWQNAVDAYAEVMSTAILRSAWVEPDASVRSAMWEPLLSFLTKFSSAWELDAKRPLLQEDEVEDDSDDEETEDDTDPGGTPHPPVTKNDGKPDGVDTPVEVGPLHSLAYAEFLDFLRSACRGSTVQGYPTVLVVLSTLPQSILPTGSAAYSKLFASFWVAVDDQALTSGHIPSLNAFLSSVLECLLYISGRFWRLPQVSQMAQELEGPPKPPSDGSESSKDIAIAMVGEQFERVSATVIANPALLKDAESIAILARSFIRLKQAEASLFNAAWTPFITRIQQTPQEGPLMSKALSVLWTQLRGTACESDTRSFILSYAGSSLASANWASLSGNSDDSSGTAWLDDLLSVLQQFGDVVFTDSAFSQSVTAVLHENLHTIVTRVPPRKAADLFAVYLTHSSTHDAADMWHTLLLEFGQPRESEPKFVGLPLLRAMCETMERGELSMSLRAKGSELRSLGSQLLEASVRGQQADGYGGLLEAMLRHHEQMFDPETTRILLSSLASSLDSIVRLLSRETDTSTTPLRDLLHTCDALDLHLRLSSAAFLTTILPALFLAAYVLPVCPSFSDGVSSGLARRIVPVWLADTPAGQKNEILHRVQAYIQESISDVAVLVRSADVAQAFLQHNPNLISPSTSLKLSDLLSSTLLTDTLKGLELFSLPSASSATNLLVAAASDAEAVRPVSRFDAYGFSVYARLASALLYVLNNDRSLLRVEMWTIRHVIALGLFASDFLAEPGTPSPVFGPSSDLDELRRTVSTAELLVSYALSTIVGELSPDWHQTIVNRLRKPEQGDRTQEPFAQLLEDVYGDSFTTKSVVSARILEQLLHQIARRTAKVDLERWLGLAQNIQDKAPRTCMAIVLGIKDTLADSPRFNRFQNELASRLSGVPPSRTNSEGLPLLRLLIAVAPSTDSLAPFIPQQRSIFLLQSLQKWVLSDEDIDEELDQRLAELFCHLAPIVQDVLGAHWDFMLDVLENNLESSTSEGRVDFQILHGALLLLHTVRELSASNSGLRDLWSERESRSMVLIRQLFLSRTGSGIGSRLQETCRRQVVALAGELRPSLVDEKTVLALYPLLEDKSVEVQKTAYHLLHMAIPKITEHRVVEAAVAITTSTEDDAPIPRPLYLLPTELIELLLETLEEADGTETSNSKLLGQLLGWMTLFDFFVDASPALKTSYAEQLRSSDLLSRSFSPTVLELLPIGKGGKPLSVQLWSIEEFYVEFYDDAEEQALSLFAAHIFYRTLSTIPSLVRSWWLDIKDRQLSSAIANFTSTNFSPIIVSAELAKLKQPQAEDELAHENLSIKIATSVSEVTVAYVIDEQQMELGIRLPPDFPLHGVEVRDIKRVAVPAEKWRQWMFQVQQTITSQNGFLLDALILFKKNITLYFEGVVECAICYSVISTTDRSLPTKRCNTCKNLFHNSCLYKWFSTSNQSSCPLCRSMF